jgi:acyl-CoA thioester hydrolase
MASPPRPQRAEYPYVQPVSSRWMDNDVYGHVNNAHYYSFFDTVVNRFLIEEGGLDIYGGSAVGYIVSSACDYFEPVAYPEPLEVGVRVDRLGSSSVRYAVALFRAGDPSARAAGTMVHVFVDRTTSRPTPVPERLRAALERIVRPVAPA